MRSRRFWIVLLLAGVLAGSAGASEEPADFGEAAEFGEEADLGEVADFDQTAEFLELAEMAEGPGAAYAAGEARPPRRALPPPLPPRELEPWIGWAALPVAVLLLLPLGTRTKR